MIIITVICASLILALAFGFRLKMNMEEKAVRKVASNFPEIGIYWNNKIDATNELQAIDKKKEALRASIDECRYLPDGEQRIDDLKASYYKACLKEERYRKEAKKAIQQINDYEKTHFGEEKSYYWPAFFEE